MIDANLQTPLPACLIAARERADAAWEALEEAPDPRIRQFEWIDTVRWLNIKKAAFAAQDYFQVEVDKWKAGNGLK
jgi:hypothetical protein